MAALFVLGAVLGQFLMFLAWAFGAGWFWAVALWLLCGLAVPLCGFVWQALAARKGAAR